MKEFSVCNADYFLKQITGDEVAKFRLNGSKLIPIYPFMYSEGLEYKKLKRLEYGSELMIVSNPDYNKKRESDDLVYCLTYRKESDTLVSGYLVRD